MPKVGQSKHIGTATQAGVQLPAEPTFVLPNQGQGRNTLPNPVNPDLTDDAQLNVFFTQPSVMDTANRTRQNDCFHRQLSRFEAATNAANDRIVLDRLHSMLMMLVPDETRLVSLSQLKKLVMSAVAEKSRKGVLKNTDSQMKKYFEKFFGEIKYHRHLKDFYQQTLYWPLYEYFYSFLEDVGLTKEDKEKDFCLSRLPNMLEEASDVKKFSFGVHHLYKLFLNWGKILNDVEMELNMFEPESAQELGEYRDHARFELVFRILPDLVVKAQSAAALAKIWWTAGNKLVRPVVKGQENNEALMARAGDLKQNLLRLEREVEREARNYQVYEGEMESLLDREERFHSLVRDYETLEQLLLTKSAHLADSEKRVAEGERNLVFLRRRDRSDDKAEAEHLKNRAAHVDLRKQVDWLKYRFEVLGGDYLAELTLRPCMIRYLDNYQQLMTNSETAVSVKQKELDEKRLSASTLEENMRRKREITGGVKEGNALPPAQTREQDTFAAGTVKAGHYSERRH